MKEPKYRFLCLLLISQAVWFVQMIGCYIGLYDRYIMWMPASLFGMALGLVIDNVYTRMVSDEFTKQDKLIADQGDALNNQAQEVERLKTQLNTEVEKGSKLVKQVDELNKSVPTYQSRLALVEKALSEITSYEHMYNDKKVEVEKYRDKFIKEQRAKEHLELDVENLKKELECKNNGIST